MRRLGFWSALGVCAINAAYMVTLAVGLANAGLRKPIIDPVLAIMEVMTLLSAPLLVMTMAAVHARTLGARDRQGARDEFNSANERLFAGSIIDPFDISAGRHRLEAVGIGGHQGVGDIVGHGAVRVEGAVADHGLAQQIIRCRRGGAL